MNIGVSNDDCNAPWIGSRASGTAEYRKYGKVNPNSLQRDVLRALFARVTTVSRGFQKYEIFRPVVHVCQRC